MGKPLPAVKFNALAGGTGDFTYSTTATGYQSPALAGEFDGQIYRYRAESSDQSQWEQGYGVISSSGTVLARTIVTYNSAGTGSGLGQSGAGSKINFTNPPVVGIVFAPEDFRERLAETRAIYVGASLGAPTISIATPAVVSLTAHGLSVNDRVVFNVPRNTRSCTITTASPAVVTLNSHGLVANQPVVFHATKYLPNPLVAGTTYFVVGASITTNTFQVSATAGGAAINTANVALTMTNGSSTITSGVNHGLVVGQIVQFSGTSVVNFSNATDYWVVSTPAANTFTVSATRTGTAIVAGVVTTNGSMVAVGSYFNTTVGALPTGITEGTTYFVISAGLTSNAFEVSTTQGGAAVNTSGSVTGAPVYNVWTGNDANSGMTQTRSGAVFTFAAAIAIAQTYDIGNQACVIQACKGVHTDGITMTGPFLTGTGYIQLAGDASIPSNVVLSPPSGTHAIQLNHPAIYLNVGGFRFVGSGGFAGAITVFAGTVYIYSFCDFGPHTGGGSHMSVGGPGSVINNQAGNLITGGASGGGAAHLAAGTGGTIYNNVGETALDVPAFTYYMVAIGNSLIQPQVAVSGSATVTSAEFLCNTGAGIDAAGVASILGNIAATATSPGWKS